MQLGIVSTFDVNQSSNAPQGIEALGLLDQVFVKQWIQYFEVSGATQMEKRYDIVDTRGRKLFSAQGDIALWSNPWHMASLDR